MKIHKNENLHEAIKKLLEESDGLSVESEGTVFIRRLEGLNICVGTLTDSGAIDEEVEFGDQIEQAIEWFVLKREELNHGS